MPTRPMWASEDKVGPREAPPNDKEADPGIRLLAQGATLAPQLPAQIV